MHRAKGLFGRWKPAVLLLGVLVALALPSAVRADAVVTMVKPWTYEDENPCTGEQVILTGHIHIVLQLHADGSGGLHAVGNFEIRGHGFEMLDPSVKYSAYDRAFAEMNLPEPTFETTQALRTRVVRAGEFEIPDDFFLHTLVHMTINAGGETTAEVTKMTAECDGGPVPPPASAP